MKIIIVLLICAFSFSCSSKRKSYDVVIIGEFSEKLDISLINNKNIIMPDCLIKITCVSEWREFQKIHISLYSEHLNLKDGKLHDELCSQINRWGQSLNFEF